MLVHDPAEQNPAIVVPLVMADCNCCGVILGNCVVKLPSQLDGVPEASPAVPRAERVADVPVFVGVKITGDPANGEQPGAF